MQFQITVVLEGKKAKKYLTHHEKTSQKRFQLTTENYGDK